MSSAGRPVTRLWYVSYGSNLLRRRFLSYLVGGPIPGATDGRSQAGSRDPTPPRDDRPLQIDHTLLFALQSKRWGGGGVAFVDPHESPVTPTLGRAWDITLEQLEDVFRQENSQDHTIAIDLAQLADRGVIDAYPSAYGRLLYLGHHEDGLPEVTLTCTARPAQLNPAHSSYLGVIREGLAECWGLTVQEATEYLSGIPQSPRPTSGLGTG